MKNIKNSWNSKFGLVLAAAGSAVGLGNLWRFPYLAAKDGGGTFLLFYLLFALILGQTLLITETALGVKSQQGPFEAFSWLHPKLKFMGLFFCAHSLNCSSVLQRYRRMDFTLSITLFIF